MNHKKILYHFALLVSGFIWGAVYLHEITLCSQMWFLLYLVLANGAGFYLGLRLPEKIWKIFLPAGLILLMLFPSGQWFGLLLPWLSGAWYRMSVLAVVDWRSSRTLSAGLFLGALLSGFIHIQLCPLVLIIFLPFLWRKYSPYLASGTAITAGVLFFCFYNANIVEHTKLSTGSGLTALGLVDCENIPKVLLSSRKSKSEKIFTDDDFLMTANPDFLPSRLNDRKYDLIIAESLPEIYDGGIGSLERMLSDKGVLVIPTEFCGALPQWHFLLLPGSEGKFAVGTKNSILSLDPEKIDRNLERYSKRIPDGVRMLPGALSGMLAGVEEQLPEKNGFFRNKNLFRIVFAGAAVIIFAALIRIFRKSRNRKDFYRVMFNSGSYTMFLMLLLPEIIQTTWYLPVMFQLLFGLGLYWYFRRPVDKNSRFSGILGVGALMAFWAGRHGNWIYQLPAVFLGGLSFSVLDGELRHNTGIKAEVIRFAGIACGMIAMSLCDRFGVSTQNIFIAVCLMRLWAILRS